LAVGAPRSVDAKSDYPRFASNQAARRARTRTAGRRKETVETISRTLEHTFLLNTYWEWIVACGVTVCCALAIAFVRLFARRRYERMVLTDQTELMEVPLQVLSKTSAFLVLTVSVAAGLATLELPDKPAGVITSVATIAVLVQLGIWTTTALVATLEQRRRTALEHDRAAVGSLGIIGFVLRFVVWVLVLLLALDNLGIDVTTLVAGLGVGGIAVALAVQNILGDLFASLSITLDKPFVVGDFLILGDHLGSVEHIGIKSVRLRSLGGEQIIIANTDLLKSRVRNYGRMVERRVVFTLRVTYETPRVTLREIPGIVRAAVEAESDTRFDRSHFAKFGDFSLDFETVYYVLSPDYNRYMDIQQRIYFAIHEAFERAKIEIAYPTRKLWLGPLRLESDLEPVSERAKRGHNR
jgi:small-conductance mechanosensitive channel